MIVKAKSVVRAAPAALKNAVASLNAVDLNLLRGSDQLLTLIFLLNAAPANRDPSQGPTPAAKITRRSYRLFRPATQKPLMHLTAPASAVLKTCCAVLRF